MHLKRRCLLFGCCLFLLLQLAGTALAANISILIDGSPLTTDVAPIVKNGRTLVPFRACAEAMNAQVDYESANQQITMTKGSQTVKLFINSQIAYINGQDKRLDEPAQISNDRTLVPLRFIGEAFNCSVEWDAASNRVIITSGSNTGNNGGQNNQQTTPPTTNFDGNVPSAEAMTGSLLSTYNSKRNSKQLNSMAISAELNQMAQAHSEDMAKNGFLSSNSPNNGGLANRTKQRNLQNVAENVAKVNLYNDSSVLDCLDQWLKNDAARANLLHPSAYYVGIGIAASPQNPAVLYVTFEIMLNDSYFSNPLYTAVNSPTATLQGYTAASQKQITVYRLSGTNDNVYLDKQTFNAQISGGKFQNTIELWGKGTYLAQIGANTIKLRYQ